MAQQRSICLTSRYGRLAKALVVPLAALTALAGGLGAQCFLSKWGSNGFGTGQFRIPKGNAVDRSGNVYVADPSTDRVQKFNSSGVFLQQFAVKQPTGVAVDGAGNVFIADQSAARVRKFTSGGTQVTNWGGTGTTNGKFMKLQDVVVDRAGTVYTIDFDLFRPRYGRVQKFDNTGNYVRQWPVAQPLAIAVDASNRIYVADGQDNRIRKFSDTGGPMADWGGEGTAPGKFRSVGGIAVDSAGNVFVADSGNDRIQVFTDSGVFLSQFGTFGSGDGQFFEPAGVAVSSGGNLYVVDSWNSRIQKFGPGAGGSVTNLGGGCGTGGTPGVHGVVGIGNHLFQLELYGPHGNVPTYLSIAAGGNPQMWQCVDRTGNPTGCELMFPLFLVSARTSGSGVAAVRFPIPCDTKLIGVQFTFQWLTETVGEAPCLYADYTPTDRLRCTIAR